MTTVTTSSTTTGTTDTTPDITSVNEVISVTQGSVIGQTDLLKTGLATTAYTVNTDIMKIFPGLEWNVWIPWTECTASCNSGTRFRLKLCASDNLYQDKCNHTLGVIDNVTITYSSQLDTMCNSHPCPIWLDWSPWSDCTATCEQGTTVRHRRCFGELLGYFECDGNSYELDFCDLDSCPAYLEPPPKEEVFKESDSRPSAIGIGSMSIIFVLIELATVIMVDSFTIASQCRYLKRNLKHLRPQRRRLLS
ncbi:hypothetical protein LSH36_138g02083 [Paralvinella palmiformis]|uniref:Uncharacterized protein n=1 Tax=Paralvinella palmiformis TaxID=53620 RepID=A0AAD9JVG4_9ANNE|nr:hypothetical protein LSH36_138g02083 [Paralvinella palmiformis]